MHAACTCFPTGQNYPGIAHLLPTLVRGLLPGLPPNKPWHTMPIALMDLETTGVDPYNDAILELGIAVAKQGRVVRVHNWLVNPGRRVPAESTAIHGITDAMVAGAQPWAQVLPLAQAALVGCIPAAYNARFDRGFLARGGLPQAQTNVTWLDPLVWARELQNEFHFGRSRSLGAVAEKLGIPIGQAHRASDDALAALRVLLALAPSMPKTYAEVVNRQQLLGQAQAAKQRFWK